MVKTISEALDYLKEFDCYSSYQEVVDFVSNWVINKVEDANRIKKEIYSLSYPGPGTKVNEPTLEGAFYQGINACLDIILEVEDGR